MSIDALLSELESFAAAGGTVDIEPAADAERIETVVADGLGLELPPEVSEFFRRFEYIDIGPDEMIPCGRLGEQYAALQDRYPQLPPTYLPIVADDIGGVYVVVCRKPPKPACSEFGSVLYVVASRSPEVDYRAGNLVQFLRNRVEMWRDGL